jgi:uncharacterized protein (DUF1501 family)
MIQSSRQPGSPSNRRPVTRRQALSTATLASSAALPRWMPRLAFRQAGQAPRGDILVSIFQRGGMDGLSAVVPHQERGYYDRRPRIAFPAPGSGKQDAAFRLDDQFGLAPAWSGLKQIWDEGQLAVVHAVGAPHGVRSHFEAMGLMERGSMGADRVNTGWLARHLASTARADDSPFRAVGFGSALPMSLRGPVPAAALRSIADFHLKGNPAELARFQAELQALYCGEEWLSKDAQDTMDAMDLLAAHDPLSYQPENGAQYPDTALGQGLKQIAQLIKADVGLEIACIDSGGWDTHVSQVWTNGSNPAHGRMHSLMKQLDEAIHAFWVDLGGRVDDPGVTLVTLSEFGRRVAQNSGNGTDHGQGSCMFVLSGAANPGVHTDWPGLEPEDLADGEDLAITTDYRDILSEILVGRMGNGRLYEVFPGHEPTFHGVVQARADAPPPATEPDKLYLPNLVNR